ncbi:MAG: leucine-rich repeat domain-containing protein [Bacteroidia bacterium]|nr:leucine-rich repeat domain-containing protein [Bacteroidia bacterium]
MKYKALMFFILLVPLVAAGQKDTDNYTNFLFGMHAGANFTKFKNDTLDFRTGAMPFAGIGLTKNLFNKFSINGCAQFSIRESRNVSPVIIHRCTYIEPQLLLQYAVIKGIKLEVGAQYAYLLNASLLKLSGDKSSGYAKFPLTGYTSSPEFICGIELEILPEIDVRFRYSNDFSCLKYNFQLGLNMKLNKLRFKTNYKKFTDFNEALQEPLNVKILVLHRQNLDSLPADIGKFLNLEKLYLDGNNLKTLPDEIGNLVNLEILSVRYNQLQSLPHTIGNITNLRELAVNNNQLTEVPVELYSLSKLNFLYIGKNRLMNIPHEIGNLTTLIEFDVASAGAGLQLPMEIFKLKSLEKLYYDDSVTLPQSADSIPRLQLIKKD